MLAGPCEVETVQWRQTLSLLSGARDTRIRLFEARAHNCRRSGHRYFLARDVHDEEALWGVCLPACCLTTGYEDLLEAARQVVGPYLFKIVAYTAFSVLPGAGVGTGTSRHSQNQELASRAAASQAVELPRTEWHSMRFPFNEEALPPRFAGAKTLAVTLREFRGGVPDYFRLIWAAIALLASHMLGAVTFLVAGMASVRTGLSESIGIHVIAGPSFCGATDWVNVGPGAALGIEISVPPLWTLFIPHYFLHANFQSNWGATSMHACEMNMGAHLHWTVPKDGFGAARKLAERGPCAAAAASKLPELGADSLFVSGNASINWTDVEVKTLHCHEQLRSATWQFHLDADNWPGLLGRGRAYREALGGPGGVITAFICVPSRFVVEADGTHDIPPEASCNDQRVGIEALPVLLAFRSGFFEVLSMIAPPMATALYGERAPSAFHWQLIDYHVEAVAQRQANRLTAKGSSQQVNLSISAAVCIVGRARSLALSEVYLSIEENVTRSLKAEVSHFYVLDTGGRSLAEYNEVFNHLPPAAIALVQDDNWGSPLECEAFQRCGPACLYQFQKLRNCLHLVQAAEASRGRNFDWLVRIRPDTKWRAPIGNLADYDANVIYMTLAPNAGDPEDNFALVPRAHAEVYFGIGEGCPKSRHTFQSGCRVPWFEGQHITPECAFRTRLHKFGVTMISFSKIYQIKREEVCRADDPRGCGQCSFGVCNYDYSQPST